jgi:TetR/AcrR family transcriptional repressor of nem operon
MTRWSCTILAVQNPPHRPLDAEPEERRRSNIRPRRGPGSRADADHPTRAELLDAAFQLLQRDGLDALSVSGVTQEAELGKGTFYIHFSGREDLIIELHRSFHDSVFSAVQAATGGLPPGAQRLEVRLSTFLDRCLQAPGARALLRHATRTPSLSAENERRWEQASAAIADDLTAIGSVDLASERARLIVAAATEVAAIELDARTRLERIRAALLCLATGHPAQDLPS